MLEQRAKITERIDAITTLPEEYAKETVPCPKSVKIELTARCNFNCSFCATGAKLREKKDMDFNFYKRIVKEMRDAGVEELGMFYLGESFLCDWLPEAIKYAKDVGFPYVFLTTNGSLATPEKVEACMVAGLDSLKFSFNYVNKTQLKTVARVGDSNFQKIIDNMRSASFIRNSASYDCGLYASSILYDGVVQQEMIEAVEEILPFVDEHYYLPLYGQAGLIDQSDGKNYVAGNQGRVGALRPALPCWSIFTEGHITYDGKLSACCFDHDGRFNMADLNETGFMDGWNSDEFKALRKANLKKEVKGTACEKCVAYG